jgi:hypothetical protein
MQANLPSPLFSKRGEAQKKFASFVKGDCAPVKIMLTVKPRDSGPATS